MNILGVIPARGGSVGIPRKNLQEIADTSLLRWAMCEAERSCLRSCSVSTDDHEIASIVERRRKAGLLWRGESTRGDGPIIPVLQEAAEEHATCDAIMCLQPTSPFRTSDDINAAIKIMEDTDCDSVISFTDVGEKHPARMAALGGDKVCWCAAAMKGKRWVPRQELYPHYIRNGAIYLVKRDVLMAGSLEGDDCRAYVMPPERSVNIDTELDLIYARALYEAGICR